MGEANKPSIWLVAPAAIRADCGFRTVISTRHRCCGLPQARSRWITDHSEPIAGEAQGRVARCASHLALPRCAACGEVVGVYERAVMVLEGGGLAHGSLLALNARDARDLYHEPCFPLRAVPE